MDAPIARAAAGRRQLVAAALILTLLSSCFTTSLWGGSIEDINGDGSHEPTFSSGREGGPNEGPNLGTKILLTPFTVILDICTSPVQAFLFGWDDES